MPTTVYGRLGLAYICWEVLVEGIPAVLLFEILYPSLERQEVCSLPCHQLRDQGQAQ